MCRIKRITHVSMFHNKDKFWPLDLVKLKSVVKHLMVLHSTWYTQLFFSSYIDVSIKACTWQLPVLSYPHDIKRGWGKLTPHRKNNYNNWVCIFFLIAVIPTPVRRHKAVLMYFLNIVTLYDVNQLGHFFCISLLTKKNINFALWWKLP